MPGRYAPAETLFNESLNQMETVETEGPRLFCGGASALQARVRKSTMLVRATARVLRLVTEDDRKTRDSRRRP